VVVVKIGVKKIIGFKKNGIKQIIGVKQNNWF